MRIKKKKNRYIEKFEFAELITCIQMI